MTDLPIAEAMSRSDRPSGRPTPWREAQDRFRKGGWFWLATVRPDGAPHVVPVFAAWSGDAFFVASKDTARKSHHLQADGRCTLTRDAGDLHLVVEGVASQITDDATLAVASRAFAEVYEWPTTVGDGKLDAEYGAPTSGGPPYDVFRVTPVKAFGFPTDGESFNPTRWRF